MRKRSANKATLLLALDTLTLAALLSEPHEGLSEMECAERKARLADAVGIAQVAQGYAKPTAPISEHYRTFGATYRNAGLIL